MTWFFVIAGAATVQAGPYTEAGISGYVDAATGRHADPLDANAVLNPIFRAWATAVVEYAPADQVWSGPGVWNDPNKALGAATGHNFDIVSLGELDAAEIAQGLPPGQITLVFADPCEPDDGTVIRNGKGYDFAVFENGFISQSSTALGSRQGKMIAELAYVEISSNGRDFARFPSVSLTGAPTGPYGTVEVSDIHNLAGKHPNANGVCTGTPFDLQDLANHPHVASGVVDLNDIRYVRIVDIPGDGSFRDAATMHTAPETWPEWANYVEDHPIYDAWPTFGSGGFDLEAVGVLHEQQYAADINIDGIVDSRDLMSLAAAWQNRFGQDQWNARYDLSPQKDLIVDSVDFAAFAAQWRHIEPWRAQDKDE
jgi:hypothetical protein